MAEERTSLIASENLPTVAAVGFVLGLLGVVLGFWSLKNVFGIDHAMIAEHSVLESSVKNTKAQDARIAALEQKVTDLEAKAAAAAAAPPAPASTTTPAPATTKP